jgi:hypothetical protein
LGVWGFGGLGVWGFGGLLKISLGLNRLPNLFCKEESEFSSQKLKTSLKKQLTL